MNGHGLTADEVRQDLTQRLSLVVARYEVALQAVGDLNALTGHDAAASMPYRSNCIEAVFKQWLEDVVRRFAEGRQGVGMASIGLPYEWLMYDTGRRRGCDDLEEMEAAVSGLLASYDFDGLTAVLKEAADGLEAKGLEEAAELLAGEFALRESRWGAPPRRTGRHWVFSVRMYTSSYSNGYDYNCLQRLSKLKDAMQVAAADAGLDGVGEAMEQIVNQIWAHRGDGLASRTRLGGGAVEGTVFKEKLEFKLSPDGGDGLLAFVAMHASSELRSLEAV